MNKVGVAYDAKSLETMINTVPDALLKYELIGLIFAKGGGPGRPSEPSVDLRVYKVYFDKEVGYRFYREEVYKSSDPNKSADPEILDIDSYYEIVDGSDSIKRAVGYETDRAVNYQFDLTNEYYSGFFGFAFFTKIDLEILIKDAIVVIISTSAIIMGRKVLDYDNAENVTTGDDSRRFLTFKAESLKPEPEPEPEVDGTLEDGTSEPEPEIDPRLEVIGIPTIVQGEPCPPHWYIGSAISAAANASNLDNEPDNMMKFNKELPPPSPLTVNTIASSWKDFALELYEELQSNEG